MPESTETVQIERYQTASLWTIPIPADKAIRVVSFHCAACNDSENSRLLQIVLTTTAVNNGISGAERSSQGQVRVLLRVTRSQVEDVLASRSQVEGAHVMALGGALFEAVHVDHGEVQNPRLSQYRVPRFSDVPEIDVELVDARAFPPAGGGETPMITVAPAIANAIFDATGTRLRALPLVPTGRVPR